ncbi:unnamed protein product [Trifolium pratense]|uniref:Uncharacterized protein n=1 Tax=Trifolium pratense TaxID=57577 RepID=A0ACB0J3P4_TRIPR|nr:unnamed protein product [Trifolium pratense]
MGQAEKRHVQRNEFRKLQEKVMAQNIKYELLDPFSTPIPSLEHFYSGNIVYFNSREKTLYQLLVALQDDNCSVIGLYGRQGSGKTTLLEAMGDKVKYLKIFHKVLFVTMIQSTNIMTIQDQIVDSLNIVFNKYTQAGRAIIISSTIKNMDRPILVIFDDVRAKLDLRHVGIPSDSNLCKVILTTRCKQEGDVIDCQKEIQLDPLSREEASILFKKHSGIHDDEEYYSSFDSLNVSREVAFECEGLPRTIKDVLIQPDLVHAFAYTNMNLFKRSWKMPISPNV